jgi:hypothetical protein
MSFRAGAALRQRRFAIKSIASIIPANAIAE